MSKIHYVRCQLIDCPITPFHIDNINQVLHELMLRTVALDKEALISLNIDSHGCIINAHLVSIGTRHSTMMDVSDIFRTALLSEADVIAVAHNHPGGNTHPSKADINMMKRLVLAGYFIDIPVFDGYILGQGNIYSFRNDMPEVFDITL
jgi:DNA repair protein RadC